MPSPKKKPTKKSAPKKTLSSISKKSAAKKTTKKLTGKSSAKKSATPAPVAAKKTGRKTAPPKSTPSKSTSKNSPIKSTPLTARATTIRTFYSDALKDYIAERYEAYKSGEEFDRDFIFDENETRSITLAGAPDAATDALAYYKNMIESRDIGSAKLLAASVEGKPTYAVYTTTDGDDGWLELYDEDGTFIGAARTYLELITFGEMSDIRATTDTGAYPAELDDRMTLTLWGK